MRTSANTLMEWREVALEEIAEIFDGPHVTPQKTASGPAFLGISNLVNGRIDLSTTQHLSGDDYLTWTRRITPMPGDVVFSYETRLGEAAAIPDGLQCCLGRRMGLLRARTESVDPRFLLYAYLGPDFQETLRARAVQGSTVDRILLSEMGAFHIEIPIDVAEQRAIAHVLGTLDDKIELNRRMNETLEEMARALFKSWFVDFDPVRAKMEGRDTGLPPEVAVLFPDRLVDSELGDIPEGWEVKELGGFAKVVKGRSYRSADLRDSHVALVTLKSVRRGGGYSPDGLKPYIGDYHPGQVVKAGDVIVAQTDVTQAADVIGQTALVNDSPDFHTLVASLDLLVVRPEHPPMVPYLYRLLQSDAFHNHALARVNGTTVLHMQKDAIPEFRFPLPTEPVIASFTRGIASLDSRSDNNVRDSHILTDQRDALLPTLISGEVEVAL